MTAAGPRATGPRSLREIAEQLREDARRDEGARPAFDASGVRWLEARIDRDRAGLDADAIDRRVASAEPIASGLAYGAFLGECIRASLGGHWHRDDARAAWGIELDGEPRRIVFPLERAAARLRRGASESLVAFFEGTSAMAHPLAPDASAPPRGPRGKRGSERGTSPGR